MNTSVVNYNIDSKKGNDLDLTLIGDIHNFYKKKFFSKIINEINDLNSDVLLIAGDISNTGFSWNNLNEFKKIKRMIEAFAEGQKVAVVLGNHDICGLSDKGIYNFKSLEDIQNVYPLFNSSVDFMVRDSSIHIDGYVPDNAAYITKLNNLKRRLLNDKDDIIAHELETLLSFDSVRQDKFNILLNHDPRLFRSQTLKDVANNYDLITGAHMHNGYVPLSYSLVNSDMYDGDFSYFALKNKTDKRGYTRGLIYGDDTDFVFVDQSGRYFYKKCDIYQPILKEQADDMIRNSNHAPLVITSGINKYVGFPIDRAEITKIKVHTIA